MARRNNKTGRSRGGGKFVMLRRNMQQSIAWRSLSLAARCLWLELSARYNGHQNEIGLSCREASLLLGCGKSTAATAFRALETAGFIALVSPAGFYQKTGRRAARWRLTHEAGNGPATNEWKLFHGPP